MDTGRALLDAILDDPDDDVRRLVYADWLEESGTHEADRMRAEFIRTGVMPATCPRASWLGALCRMRNMEPVPGGFKGEPLFRCIWRGGFVEEVECAAADWLDHAADVLAGHPVRRLRLRDTSITDMEASEAADGWAYTVAVRAYTTAPGPLAPAAPHQMEMVDVPASPGDMPLAGWLADVFRMTDRRRPLWLHVGVERTGRLWFGHPSVAVEISRG